MISRKQSIMSWWILILLTFVSVFIGEVLQTKFLFLSTVLAIVLVKGQQIVDVFMELSCAPKKWRLLLLSYVLLIPLVILIIYSI